MAVTDFLVRKLNRNWRKAIEDRPIGAVTIYIDEAWFGEGDDRNDEERRRREWEAWLSSAPAPSLAWIRRFEDPAILRAELKQLRVESVSDD